MGMGIEKPPPPAPRPVHQDSMTSTETDGETEEALEETMQSETDIPSGVLEESQVQETVLDEEESMEVA